MQYLCEFHTFSKWKRKLSHEWKWFFSISLTPRLRPDQAVLPVPRTDRQTLWISYNRLSYTRAAGAGAAVVVVVHFPSGTRLYCIKFAVLHICGRQLVYIHRISCARAQQLFSPLRRSNSICRADWQTTNLQRCRSDNPFTAGGESSLTLRSGPTLHERPL